MVNVHRGNKWNLGALFRTSDISQKTRQHLVQVYSTWMTSTFACACGMMLNSGFFFDGNIVGILSFVLTCYLRYRNNGGDHPIILAFFMGLTAGPAISMISPVVLVQAVI